MSPTQTKIEYQIDRISERLGVPKVEGQAFAPDPLTLLTALVNLLADPAAAKKRVAEFAAAASAAHAAAEQARAEQKKSQVAYDGLADARAKHDEKLASELAAHTMEMQRRTRELDGRAQAVAAREKEADALLAELAADRADVKRRLEAIRTAAA